LDFNKETTSGIVMKGPMSLGTTDRDPIHWSQGTVPLRCNEIMIRVSLKIPSGHMTAFCRIYAFHPYGALQVVIFRSLLFKGLKWRLQTLDEVLGRTDCLLSFDTTQTI
jgi:hypothetical protein